MGTVQRREVQVERQWVRVHRNLKGRRRGGGVGVAVARLWRKLKTLRPGGAPPEGMVPELHRQRPPTLEDAGTLKQTRV